ncbi:MAG: AraC family transcriptional regulator [Stenomitos rutilans HA7619-LM2]|jgi:AraC family transcriptional regulator|nr:AraC family transcriptional regulator [Stenomitos rutilans HA7619-LM2]
MVTSNPIGVDLTQQNDAMKLYPKAPILSSDRAGWNGIRLEYHQQPPHQVPENALNQSQIIIHTQRLSSPFVGYMQPQSLQSGQIERGDVTIIPAHVHNWAIWKQECHFILLQFHSTIFEQYASEWTSSSEIALLPSFSQPDPLIYGIGLPLKSVLEADKFSDRLYVDSLTTTLIIHLLRRYSIQKQIPEPTVQGLLRHQLKQVTDYIDHHLDQDLTLSELAAIAQISPSYFSALFKQSTGLAPHQFVIQRRIERAKQLLRQGKASIAEVAHNLGFTHQSHLSRHFKRLVGVTPKAFLKGQ